MPKFIVAVDRTAEYKVEAESASRAIDIVFGDGIEGHDYKEVGGETTGHRVYDEDGNELHDDEEAEEEAK